MKKSALATSLILASLVFVIVFIATASGETTLEMVNGETIIKPFTIGFRILTSLFFAVPTFGLISLAGFIVSKIKHIPPSERTIQKTIDKQNYDSKVAELEAASEVFCPRCLSTKLTANKKGFSVGKAVVGSVLTLGIGALAGAAGANKVQITCLNCGHQWIAGKAK